MSEGDTGRTYWDVKVYEEGEEQETIRDLTYAQKHAIMAAFDRVGATAAAIERSREDDSIHTREEVNGRHGHTVAVSSGDYDPVVCSNCGKGDWRDHEPGDSLRCPWCESRHTLMWLSEYREQDTEC